MEAVRFDYIANSTKNAFVMFSCLGIRSGIVDFILELLTLGSVGGDDRYCHLRAFYSAFCTSIDR